MNDILKSKLTIPVGGRIRAGIKILNPRIKDKEVIDLYKKGVKAKASNGAIAAEIYKRFEVKNALIPKNVPYFSVHPSDFVVSSTADQIMELYGSDGPAGYQLYKFPVVFPVDDINSIMPHNLSCFGKSGLRYWSDYSEDGTRVCRQRKAAEKGVRVFGGRPVTTRRVCDPEKCDEYQKRECTLRGQFIFYMPEIIGSAAIALSTTSFYSLDKAMNTLNLIAGARDGVISGVVNGKPIFWFTKKLEKVSMIDVKTGEPRQVDQYLTVLESSINVGELFVQREMGEAKNMLMPPEEDFDG